MADCHSERNPLEVVPMTSHEIRCRYFSQEDLLAAGCFDLSMAMAATADALRAFDADEVLFPEKIVQIFREETQERINCLPATFLERKICGVKWVSVFPPNPVVHGVQNLSAVIILSEIERGFPIAFMDGTLCSNVRVASVGGLAARYLARQDSESIGFIGAGEQAKVHLVAMKTALPSLRQCRVASKLESEEDQFIAEMSAILPEMEFVKAGTVLERAVDGVDVIVTATSAQAPLLEAAWMKAGAFYSHIGGWEDEYAVAKSLRQDRLRRLGDREAPHPDAEPACTRTASCATRTFTPTSWTWSQGRRRAERPTRSAPTSTPSAWPTST